MIVNKIIRYVLVLSIVTVTPFNLIASNPGDDQDELGKKHSQAIQKTFENVTITPAPESISHTFLKNSCHDMNSGNTEIHFCNVSHLKELSFNTKYINPKNVCFVYDKDVQDDKLTDFLFEEETNIGHYFMLISDEPLTLDGVIDCSNTLITIPPKSILGNLKIAGKRVTVTSDTHNTFNSALALADVFEDLENQKLPNRIDEVAALFKQHRDLCQSQPELFPSLDQLSSYYLVSRSEINISQIDYLTASHDLIYAAPTALQLKELKSQYPDFNRAVCLIDPRLNGPSLFSTSIFNNCALKIVKGFNISASSDLTLINDIITPDHYINFNIDGKFWGLNGVVRAPHINFNTQETTFKKMTNIVKPDGMTDVEWEWIVDFLVEKGYARRATPN